MILPLRDIRWNSDINQEGRNYVTKKINKGVEGRPVEQRESAEVEKKGETRDLNAIKEQTCVIISM